MKTAEEMARSVGNAIANELKAEPHQRNWIVNIVGGVVLTQRRAAQIEALEWAAKVTCFWCNKYGPPQTTSRNGSWHEHNGLRDTCDAPAIHAAISRLQNGGGLEEVGDGWEV